jgi:glycosyltransferase involved in cell wall biosynthesis
VVGPYDARDLDRLLDEFDVGVVPSIWEEAYGYVGVEFLAKGIPVIGNALGGILDYTRDGETGWLNQSADAEGLAEIIAAIAAAPEQVPELNASIRADRDQIVKPFGRHVEEMVGLYEELIGAAAAREADLARSAK